MNKNLLSLVLLTMLLDINVASGQSAKSVQSRQPVDGFIENKMNQTGIVGMGASIIVDGKVIWSKGYGFADKENHIPFSTSTIMNIASISKTFTGVCIMKAVEEGFVDLDEDINHYLDFKLINPYFPNEKITLRHLATHTSSLADRYPFYSDSTIFYDGRKPEPLGEFLKNYFVPGGRYYSLQNFLNVKPGTSRDYSNIGAGLAGYVIERKMNKTLQELARKYIFNPLGMRNSGWSLNDIDIRKHTKLYEKKSGKIVPVKLYEGITYPDGGVRTSVEELSAFFIALLNEGEFKHRRILKKETVEEMLRFQYTETNKPDNVDPNEINQGIFWATKANVTRIGHNGTDPGVRTFMLSDVNKEIAVIIFFNTSLPDEEDMAYVEIFNALYDYGIKLKKN